MVDKCVSIIFNPVSGQTDPERRKKAISDALAEHGYTCQFVETTQEEGARALAEKAVGRGVDLVAVSGGDGTVMEAMAALVGTDIPVAVLPAGTGNLLSVNLGIPVTVPEAVHVALSGRRYHLDLAKTDDGRFFAIMGGLGLDAQVIADAGREAKNRLGPLAYFLSALKNLGRRPAHVSVQLDERPPFRRRAKTVMVVNMGRMTGGVEAMPTAAPDDGLLDIGIVKARHLGHWARLFVHILLGRAHEAPDLEVHQARRVTLRTRRLEPTEFDGEDGPRTRTLTVEIVPRAVQVLLPENAPAAQNTHQPPAETARRNGSRRAAVFAALVLAIVGAGFWVRRRR